MLKAAVQEDPSPEKAPERSYVCINCGAPIDKLYKKYSPTILKILHCEECGEVADKYIEFEVIIILIDLVLLSKPAYRHIFNIDPKTLWKLAVILVLLESYCIWKERFNNGSEQHRIFELEKAFYFSALEALIANVLLYLWIGALGTTSKCFRGDTGSPERSGFTLNLLKALILASIGNFLFLPILIWKENTTSLQVAIHLALVVSYFLLSLVRGHSVVSHGTPQSSLFIVLVAFAATALTVSSLDPALKSLFFDDCDSSKIPE